MSLSKPKLTDPEKRFCDANFRSVDNGVENCSGTNNNRAFHFIKSFLIKKGFKNGYFIAFLEDYLTRTYGRDFKLHAWISLRKFVGFLQKYEKESLTPLDDTMAACFSWKKRMEVDHPYLPVCGMDVENVQNRCDVIYLVNAIRHLL